MSSKDGRDLESREPPLQSCGRYQLMSRLGSGGMAEVWLARVQGEGGFERLFAVKIALPELRDDREIAAMFLDEARIAARIHHPNVVSTIDVGRTGKHLWIAMDYVDGARLVDLIRSPISASLLPVPIVLRIMIGTLRGLHAAHELVDGDSPLGIVHRDVSPANIMVDNGGTPKLLDFGIAKANTRIAVTQQGQLKGKIGYMSPEQLAGGDVTRATDIYGAGVVLWEALVGKRLMGGSKPSHTVKSVLYGEIVPPSAKRSGLDSRIDAIALKALAPNPRDRFGSAKEFADALEACGLPVATTSDVADYIARWTQARRANKLDARPPEPDTVFSPQTAGNATPIKTLVLSTVGVTVCVVLLAFLVWSHSFKQDVHQSPLPGAQTPQSPLTPSTSDAPPNAPSPTDAVPPVEPRRSDSTKSDTPRPSGALDSTENAKKRRNKNRAKRRRKPPPRARPPKENVYEPTAP